jgi:phosphoserine aminotransferase
MTMSRVFNFSAGPATLPEPVLAQVREEVLDWHGTGMSVMEMSHRDKPFMSIAAHAEQTLRSLLGIRDDYHVLFLQGGATAQFAAIPMNLARGRAGADYVLTGSWGRKAHAEAGKYLAARVAARPEGKFTSIPDPGTWQLDPQAAYVHYTPNETIEGVEFGYVPASGDVPLVADFSSSFLSRPIAIGAHGLVYAGAQKNAGPAGLVIVIVRKDLLGEVHPACPTVLDYAQQAAAESMLNTPACFAWYVAGLVFDWIAAQGGLPAMAQRNREKAQLLYDAIAALDFYASPVAPGCRSWMNIPFTLADAELDSAFLKGAAEAGLVGLKGHRSVGGMRASLYNAMPRAGVEALVGYMREFARTHG